MENQDYEYRIVYRNIEDGKRHTIFAENQIELIEKLKVIKGHLQCVDRNPELPRV